MNERDLPFKKKRLLNRFIAVRFQQIPKASKMSFVVGPVADGMGLKVDLEGIERLGLSTEESKMVRSELLSLNKVFAMEHCKQQAFAINVLESKEKDDLLTYLGILCAFIAFGLSYAAVNTNVFINFIKFVPFVYMLVILLAVKLTFSSIAITPRVPPDLVSLLKPYFNQRIMCIQGYLRKNRIKVTYCPDLFWVKFELEE